MLAACLSSSVLVMGQERPDFPEHLMLINEARPKIPYPIIYVHGLVGNATTWEETSSFLTDLGLDSLFSFGFDQCKMALHEQCGFRHCKFYSEQSGFCESIFDQFQLQFIKRLFQFDSQVQSNQSGIYKQAEAIGIAIDEVLNATGAKKVILLQHGRSCHASTCKMMSIGVTKTTVAKLVTSGSPHFGFDLGKVAKW